MLQMNIIRLHSIGCWHNVIFKIANKNEIQCAFIQIMTWSLCVFLLYTCANFWKKFNNAFAFVSFEKFMKKKSHNIEVWIWKMIWY